ncbi:MAG: DUF4492 domain-containing protein [Bacteroidales bacterium]|nr:DUF4492 domain-containing protein [Bacteroidales bacterium]MDD3892818.1 DUF4492 domain-containing protein [Bacteroidales bacterium]
MKVFFYGIVQVATNTITTFRNSKLAQVLLIIVLIKIFIFYGLLKGFIYPRYLKPKWDSKEHRSNDVMKDLLNKPKTYTYDGIY